MTSGHQHHASAQPKRLQHEVSVHPARAHHPYGSYGGRILKAACASKVSTRITAPVAEEGEYLALRVLFQGGSNLGEDLGIGEVHLSNGVRGAFSRAGAAAVTHGSRDLSWLSLGRFYGPVGAPLRADTALHLGVSALFGVHHRYDGLDLPRWLREDGGGACGGPTSLGHAVRYVLGALACAGQKDSINGGIDGLKLWVALHEESVSASCDVEDSRHFLGALAGYGGRA
ncbi:MAG: hypothetical protein AOA65_1968 [Candidatus Bathyarchaeota archaeon BA1]|nr:MAG: hypothetical protein AOA65_1968 [Candidatus Bathyarchaeota archaeon BA1]